MPIGGASQMREECKDSEKIVWPKEKLVRRHVKASSGEVEVRIEIENGTPVQNCSNMHKQEERE